MKKVLLVITSMLVVSVMAVASVTAPPDNRVPEIDANTATSAVALLSGALMMLRRKR